MYKIVIVYRAGTRKELHVCPESCCPALCISYAYGHDVDHVELYDADGQWLYNVSAPESR